MHFLVQQPPWSPLATSLTDSKCWATVCSKSGTTWRFSNNCNESDPCRQLQVKSALTSSYLFTNLSKFKNKAKILSRQSQQRIVILINVKQQRQYWHMKVLYLQSVSSRLRVKDDQVHAWRNILSFQSGRACWASDTRYGLPAQSHIFVDWQQEIIIINSENKKQEIDECC